MRECGCVEEAVGGGCERCTSMGAGNDVQRAAAAAALCGGRAWAWAWARAWAWAWARAWARAWAGAELCCAGSTQAIFWLGAGPASTASFPCDSRCQGARAGKGRDGLAAAALLQEQGPVQRAQEQEGSTATATARNRGANRTETGAKTGAKTTSRARTDGRARARARARALAL